MAKKHEHESFRPKSTFDKKFEILTPPIIFSELLTKITLTPDTPSDFLKEVSKYELDCEAVVTKRTWHPNVHMEAYQRRMLQKKHNRELGI